MAWQALDAIPRDRAEWLCWIDMDIVLADPTFTFPLDKVNYTDRDIIIWGGKKQILAGDAEYGGSLCPGWSQHLSPVGPGLDVPPLKQRRLASVPAGLLGRQTMVEQLLAGCAPPPVTAIGIPEGSLYGLPNIGGGGRS